MLYPKTRWVIRESNELAGKELAKQLNIAPLVATLLVNRGISDHDEAKKFLYTENEEFHSPFLLNDMQPAVERIKSAIEGQEPILIFGDYDADGVTSTSVMMDVLSNLGANVRYYIPNRFTEGYGPNENAFREAAASGIKLVITVDTGISATNEASLAKELGMDLIITDHHEPGQELPDAFAIIHPKLPNTNYPFPDLAGVGVAFKLAHALSDDVPWHLLDLAAIGTIADLVPLHGENRLIVKAGLKRMATSTRPGLLALCKIAGTKLSDADEEMVGFAIAPRLNAAGRLEHAGPAVELLMTNDSTNAAHLAEEIDAMNKERKFIVTEITKEAVKMVEEEFPPEENNVIVIGKEGWNPGVIGIVASRLVERFYRPAIVLSYDKETGMAKGSARSIHGFDLFKNLTACKDLLPHFGGHPMAAGMTLHTSDVELLRTKLNHAADAQLSAEDYIPITELDASLDLAEIDLESIRQLDMLAPYGMKNPKPKVMVHGADASGIRKIGGNKTHLKLTLEKPGYALDGVGFHLGGVADEISPGSKVSVIGELSINEWNNIKKPQILLKDIAIKDWQLFDMRGNKKINEWISQINDKNTSIIIFSEKHLNKFSFSESMFNTVVISDRDQAEKLDISKKNIVLFDLPQDIEMLEKLVSGKKPARIYTHFYQEENHFFSTLPTRDHFKWYYAFLIKRRSFDMKKYGNDLAAHRGWSRETIEFMSQVFFELDFVTIKDGLITINSEKTKKDLSDSPAYQRKQAQMNVEKELLYSSYQQLKQWFDDRLVHTVPNEEEIKVWT
ncbi:single-stranded-DNA-specific exonuclease RecJ [Lederbergia citrea]|uniref:single-stranded-DNA-specific exonuclease RecJ n=1 Tax=Lederbergia citrea TaxID=2833581 RepID=UPI001BC92970|nr:single-stranded-DNA-specific exonuclease RecJ [Lederbergia citrea]MBS4176226.1 single-stranded-DNA-specific exonuclease RecJ [Lederbergia citrea]